MIPTSEYGCVMENGKKEVLKKYLKKILDQGEERLEIAENGCRRIREYFTWDNVADQVEKL